MQAMVLSSDDQPGQQDPSYSASIVSNGPVLPQRLLHNRRARRAVTTVPGSGAEWSFQLAGTQAATSVHNGMTNGWPAHPQGEGTAAMQPLAPARQRQQFRSRLPMAAISFAWLDFSREGGLRTAISDAYVKIDVDQSGSLSLEDLAAYATSHGLPTAYIHQFMSAVLTSHEQLHKQQANSPTVQQQAPEQQQPVAVAAEAEPVPVRLMRQFMSGALQWLPLRQAAGSQAHAAPPELTYAMFERFVRSRETALRRAFDMFDRDRDGVISAEDLEASLAHVAICCPRTRCIYRCPRALAHAMLERTKVAGQTDGSRVDFASFRRFFMLLPETDMAVEYWLRAGSVPTLTEKLAAVHEGEEHTQNSVAWGHLLAGAVAGAASRTATAPLETLRLAVMTGSLPASNLVQAASSIVESGGWQALYRGNAINVLRSAPQKALDFFAFDGFKRLLMGGDSSRQAGRSSSGGGGGGGSAGSAHQGSTALKTFAAAGLAGASSWALLYPLETVRSRITAGVAPAGLGIISLARAIISQEGVGALYRGLGWSLAGIFPEAALCYGLHDWLKQVHRRSHRGQEPGVMPSLSYGVVAAFTGQLVAFPLETISRRLQVYQGPGGLPTMLREMFSKDGPMVLYRGVGAATLRLIPMAIVSFGTYEVVRSALMALEEQAEVAAADSEYAALHRYCTPLTATTPPACSSTLAPATSSAAPAGASPCTGSSTQDGAAPTVCMTATLCAAGPVAGTATGPVEASKVVSCAQAGARGGGAAVPAVTVCAGDGGVPGCSAAPSTTDAHPGANLTCASAPHKSSKWRWDAVGLEVQVGTGQAASK